MSSGHRLVVLRNRNLMFSNSEQLSYFVDDMSLRRRRGRPRMAFMDKEVALAPHTSPPHGDP